MAKPLCIAAVLALGICLAALGLEQEEAQSLLARSLREGLQLSVDKGCGGSYLHNDRLNISVLAERSGYLTVFDFMPDGVVQIVFPNAYHTDNRIEGGTPQTLPGAFLPFELVVGPPDGKEVLFAVVTEKEYLLFPKSYYDFSKVFPELPGGAVQAAGTLTKGLQVIPRDMWWAASMCTFTVSSAERASGPGWGLFIGISDYRQHEYVAGGTEHHITDLRYSDVDAQAMARALEGTFPEQRLLLNDLATRDAIQDAIRVWLAQAPPDAPVLLYYSGHGGRQPDLEGDEEDGQDETLIPTDARPISDDEMALWVSELTSSRIVLIIDSCHSGSMSRAARTFVQTALEKGPGLTDGFSADFGAKGAKGPGKVISLTACGPAEEAVEVPELGHGLFTYCLLRGMAGPADGNADKAITAQELFAYSRTCISENGAYGAQNPELRDELRSPVALVTLE